MKCFSFTTSHFLLTALAVVIIAVSVFPTVHSVCCHSYYDRLCADCSKPTTSYLFGINHCGAGEGGCNRAGCDCDGGCRQPPIGKKACAPTNQLFVPLSKSKKNCWLMDEYEECPGRAFYRFST